MSAQVITIAQQKGGAGKTTLAIHLAIAWSLQGKSVIMLDIDPQGSLTKWYNTRIENFGQTAKFPEVRTVTGWRVSNEVSRLAQDHDIVVIDSPPHTQTEAKIAIRSASLAIIPVQPSPVDMWATEPTVRLAAEERVPLLLVLNRVPPRTTLTEEIVQGLKAYDASIANTTLGNRVLLASSLLVGRGIGEYSPKSQACEEINALAAEVLQFGKKTGKKAA